MLVAAEISDKTRGTVILVTHRIYAGFKEQATPTPFYLLRRTQS